MARYNQSEVLVLASAAANVTRDQNSKSICIQNLGPNAIWVKVAGTAAVGTCHRLLTGEVFSMDIPGEVPVSLKASSADQVTTAATIVTQA